MRRHCLILLALVGTSLCPQAAVAQFAVPPVPADVKYYPDLVYRQLPDRALQLDIAQPAPGDGPLPVVVILHGTVMTKGRKANVPLAFRLAGQSYVGVAISFRYTAHDPYPAPVEDVRAAVRWLRANAKQYRIDPERIAALGYSGGGTLACLLGMTEDAVDRREGRSSNVQAVVAYFPPTDFVQLHADLGTKKVGSFAAAFLRTSLEKWLSGTPKTAPERYREVSPVTHVHKTMAPTLLLHGTADKVVPVEQSRLLLDRATAKGARVTLLQLPDAGHNFDERNDVNSAIAAQTAQIFLDRHLKASKSAVAAR